MIAPCKKCGGKRTAVKKGSGTRYRCRPCEAAYQRSNYAQNLEHMRKRKAKYMANARRDLFKREGIIASQRKAYANGGAEKQRERNRRMQVEEPFRWRAYLLRKLNPSITADDLERLWNQQDGLCALTGQPMTIADADVDHRVPKSRGGSSDLSNLRWVCRKANAAKGDMLDEEFLTLCFQVSEWIGRRIMEYLHDHR